MQQHSKIPRLGIEKNIGSQLRSFITWLFWGQLRCPDSSGGCDWPAYPYLDPHSFDRSL